jgi:hypothetical protein
VLTLAQMVASRCNRPAGASPYWASQMIGVSECFGIPM